MVEKRKMEGDVEERSEKRRRRITSRGNVKEMIAGAYVSGSIQPKPSSSKPVIHHVLRLDAKGREIDEDGKLVVAQSCLTTLKVNINKKQNKDAAAAFRINLKPKSPSFDPRVQGMGINPNKQQLFRRTNRRPTLILRVDEAERAKDELLVKPKAELADINPNLIDLQQRRLITKEESSSPIPNVEWWDVPFLKEEKLKKMITIYVEHPRPIEPPAGSEAAHPPPQPLKLTKHERKKLRTQKRVARRKDIQEMIRLGVLEPPRPRLKLSNIMKLCVGTQDPTRLEMEIRRAAAEREQAHMDRNIARKLTPEGLRQKKARKLFNDDDSISSNTIVSVYKLMNVDLSRHRFKVDINAQQNSLTGCATAIISSDKGCASSVVVVEGCNNSINRYKKLVLERMNWSSTRDEEDENDDSKCKCVLVWEGSVAQPNFTRFMAQGCTTQVAAARKFFSDHGVAHYLDLALNFDHHSRD